MIRLDKLLSNQGVGSRKEVNRFIREGRVLVNNRVITVPKTKVEETDEILVDRDFVVYQQYVYYMMHKPMGVLSATRDRRETVVDLLDEAAQKREVFPVGRLDRDTTGLLLLTNDGRLAHALLSPKHHVEKEYLATLDQPADEKVVARLKEGIELVPEHIVTMPARVEILPNAQAKIVIMEGKYHQVKRMFAACQRNVIALHRLRMGSLVLDDTLLPGEFRPLRSEEIKELQQAAQILDTEDAGN